MKPTYHLLLAFALPLPQVVAQSPPGFISLDCGLRGSNSYNGSDFYYTTDEAYIETGESRSISPEFRTSSLPRNLLHVRSFPGAHGKKRLLHLGVDLWETVTFRESTSIFSSEIMHIPTSDYLYVCLVNSGLGTPFMSVLEMRPMDPLTPTHTMQTDCTSGRLSFEFGVVYAAKLVHANAANHWSPFGEIRRSSVSIRNKCHDCHISMAIPKKKNAQMRFVNQHFSFAHNQPKPRIMLGAVYT